MSKYLYKAQTDLFKFTLNLNCNNELFKMLFFSHNNNTTYNRLQFSECSERLNYTNNFLKEEILGHHKKGKCQNCKIFAGVLQNNSFHSNQMLLSFSFASIVNNTPRKFPIRGFNSIFREERGTKENFVK